jgi:UMF1 family MFS transporter
VDADTKSTGLLARIGLRTKAQKAWAMYDWANSAMVVIIITAIYPVFFPSYAASDLAPEAASFRLAVATTIGLAIIAVLAPFLGAMADQTPLKKRMLGAFLALGVTSVGMMFFIQQGSWLFALVLFVLANIGANGSFVFYDALLPHVAPLDEMDRVSTAGYALGYVGGGLLLAACAVMLANPGLLGLPSGDGLTPAEASLPARLSFVAVAIWWVVFALPLFRGVPEPPVRGRTAEEIELGLARAAIRRLGATVRELRKYRNAFLMLLAFLIYNDGIGTIIRMGVIFGDEIGIERGALIGAVILVQFVGIPFAFLFGGLATRIGAKRAIFLGLAVYCGISIFGFFIQTATDFFILATLVAMVQGGTQALSRSLFGSMIPRHESGEFFGLFAVFEKFAGILGPGVFALAIAVTGSSRNAILSIVVFFVVGAALLSLVNVEEGQKVARDAERAAA